jgi:hypothetical protein
MHYLSLEIVKIEHVYLSCWKNLTAVNEFDKGCGTLPGHPRIAGYAINQYLIIKKKNIDRFT